MPSGALCEKPKDASSTRKQLSSGPLALALICATGTLVGQPSLVEERTRRERRARRKLREVLGVKMRPVRACGPHCITYHHVAEGYTYFIVSYCVTCCARVIHTGMLARGLSQQSRDLVPQDLLK